MLWKKAQKAQPEKPLPIPGDYLSSVCEVKNMTNELVATGAVTEITPEYIQITDRTNSMIALRFGTKVKVSIFNTRLGFRVVEGKIYVSNHEFMRIVEINNLLEEEQRTSFRVRTTIRGRVFQKGEAMVASGGIGILIEDLSLGGALLRSSENFSRGEQLTLQFTLEHLVLQLVGNICRIKRLENGVTEYGFAFEEIPEAQQDALCAYLFRRQREQLNSQRR